VIDGSYRDRPASSIRGSGYAVACLEAALWAFAREPDFGQAVLAAVNLGDDADTTGAVCGQLAGAHRGLSGIPDELRSGLVRRHVVETAARRLLEVDPAWEPPRRDPSSQHRESEAGGSPS
jgi:ADP-ribosyl-[dinitrogen reductase] hydrolase